MPREIWILVRNEIPHGILTLGQDDWGSSRDKENADYYNFSIALSLPIYPVDRSSLLSELPFFDTDQPINEWNVQDISGRYPNGLCYLSSIPTYHIPRAFMNLGYYPNRKKWIRFLLTYGSLPCTVTGFFGVAHVMTLDQSYEVPSIETIEYENDEGLICITGISIDRGLGLSFYMRRWLRLNPSRWMTISDPNTPMGASRRGVFPMEIYVSIQREIQVRDEMNAMRTFLIEQGGQNREDDVIRLEDYINRDLYNFSLAIDIPAAETRDIYYLQELPYFFPNYRISDLTINSYEGPLPSGLCYLSSVPGRSRSRALVQLGYYPKEKDWVWFLTMHDCLLTTTTRRGGVIHVKSISSPLEIPGTIKIVYLKDNILNQFYVSTTNGMGISHRLRMYLAKNPEKWDISSSYPCVVGAEFGLFDILQVQGRPGDIEVPNNYFSIAHPEVLCEAHLLPSTSNHVDRVDLWLPDDSHRTYSVDDINGIKHVRHDFVANMLRGSTDMNLSELGMNVNLTPDCIIKDSRKVLELATVAIDVEALAVSSYRRKRLAYEDKMKPYLIDYFILVVTPSRVLTNAVLQQETVDELCWRCRVGLSLENQIEEVTGKSYINQDDNEDNKEILDILSLIDNMPRRENVHFRNQMSLDALRENTEMEDMQVVDMLTKRFKECMGDKKQSDPNSINVYKETIRGGGVQSGVKRIFNFPCLHSRKCNNNDLGNVEMLKTIEPSLEQLWAQTFEHESFKDYNKTPAGEDAFRARSINEALDPKNIRSQHTLRERDTFKANLSDRDLDFLALSGIGAKFRNCLDSVLEHEEEAHKSFDPDADTEDIRVFIEDTSLHSFDSKNPPHENILKFLAHCKDEIDPRSVSQGVMRHVASSDLVKFASDITDVCTELSYEYKVPHRPNKWGVKKLRGKNIWILYRSTGSHMFVSLQYLKSDFTVFETGRLGPELYERGKFIVSDFMSFNEHSLENLVKAAPYMCGIGLYLLQHFSLPILTRNIELPSRFFQTWKTLLLLFLNNKIDAEEIVTTSRFLYMRVLQEFDSDPFKVLNKFPSILRSRLSVFLMKRIFEVMNFYRRNIVGKRRIRNPDGKTTLVHTNLRSIFHRDPVTIDELVDSFYFGYVVSKAKGKSGDRSYKIVSKILKEELWYQDNIVDKELDIMSFELKPKMHTWNPNVIRYFLKIVKTQWKSEIGPTHDLQLKKEILHVLSRIRFSDMSTLKASSKDFSDPDVIFPQDESCSGTSYVNQLKELNPKFKGKRPRVITSLVRLIKDYMRFKNDKFPTPAKVMHYSLQTLLARGWFYSDCFPKDQHGGDREIHVLEIMARMFQYYFEKMSLVIGRKFGTDSVCQPHVKDNFVKDHESLAHSKLGDHITLGKSADATKWCQRHHVSKFMFILTSLTSPIFHGFLYQSFYLFTNKRIAIPEQLLSTLSRTPSNKIHDPLLLRLKEAFLEGSNPFVKKGTNLITVMSGMFQGIPHRTGGVVHDVLQTGFAELSRKILGANEIPHHMSVIQGSDDSACLISCNKQDKKTLKYLNAILEWKEKIGEYFSIWISEAKSSIGTVNLVEYNSEWWAFGKIIKPTFRWVSASLETGLVEVMVDRYLIFYNVLTQCLENGGSTYLCSLLQLCQAWLHYLLLGLHNHLLSEDVINLLKKSRNPSLGYFNLDSDYSAGITGYDFMIYREIKEGRLDPRKISTQQLDPDIELEYEGSVDTSFKQGLREARLPFSSKKKWHSFRRDTSLGTLEDAIDMIEENPISLYDPGTTWAGAQIQMIISIYNKGAVQSLSSYQPTIRMMSASAYIINRPCFRTWDCLRDERHSLYRLLIDDVERSKTFLNYDKLQRLPIFPLESQYENFLEILRRLERTSYLQDTYLVNKSKIETTVWSPIETVTNATMLDVVKRAWWDLPSIHVARTTFASIWAQAKAKFPFLRDTAQETCDYTGLDNMSLYLFIMTLDKKERKLTMQDVPARSHNVFDTMTRVLWPQVKVLSSVATQDTRLSSLRHQLYSLATFFYNDPYKLIMLKKLILASDMLDTDISSLPSYGKKLKILREYLMNGDRNEILLDISSTKSGSLGFFSVRQKGVEGPNRKVFYTGKGLWVGEVSGIPCSIELFNDKVVLIKIKSLREMYSLSHGLRSLLDESRVSHEAFPDKSPDSLYIDTQGNFVVDRSAKQGYAPVVVDSTISSDNLNNFLKLDWDISLEGNTIRLFSIEFPKSKHPRKHTIISESLKIRDWDTYTSTEFVDDDKLFESWVRGLPFPINYIHDYLRISPNYRTIRDNLSQFRGQDSFGLNSRYSKVRFWQSYKIHLRSQSEMIRSTLDKDLITGNEKSSGMQTTMELGEVMKTDLAVFQEVMQSTTPLNIEQAILQQGLTQNWEDEEKIDANLLGEISEELLDDIVNLLMEETDFDKKNKLEREVSSLLMPLENNFFLSVDNLARSSGQFEVLLDLMKYNLPIPPIGRNMKLIGSLSCLLSILTEVDLLGDPLQEGDDMILKELSEFETSFDERHVLTAQDLDNLSAEVDQLTQLVQSSPPLFKKRLEQVLRRKIMELEFLKDQEITVGNDVERLDYLVVLNHILEWSKDNKIWDKSYLVDEDRMLTIFLSDCLERVMMLQRVNLISSQEVHKITTMIWTKVISKELLLAVSIGLSTKISIFLDSEEVLQVDNPISHNQLSLRYFTK